VHDYEASDGKGKEELGKGASGCSPLLMGRSEPNDAFEEEPFNLLKEIDSRGTYDKKDLLVESTNQTFPCIACNDHKNILDPSTWVPAFLRKSSTTTWDVFDVNFDQTVHNLEWNGDEGLENLWGLYYKCPDAQFIRSLKSNCKTSATPSLEEGKMKDTIKATNDGPQGCHKFHRPHPISDDATTAAFTFSSLITSLTPGTNTSSSTDALIKCNANFQKALEKHQEDILCLIRKCATSGTPAIPKNMVGKVWEANLATMKSINKEALHHGGNGTNHK
jgi:hypothetical protein